MSGEKRKPCPFQVTENTIELAINYQGPAYDYEWACLYGMAAELPKNSMAFGPRLTETVLGRSGLGGAIKPDILVFRNGSPLWRLECLVEVRNCKPYQIGRKIGGFDVLLHRLRKNPKALRYGISSVIGSGYVSLPDYISIPANREIEVIFMSPVDFRTRDMPPTGFKVSFVKY